MFHICCIIIKKSAWTAATQKHGFGGNLYKGNVTAHTFTV